MFHCCYCCSAVAVDTVPTRCMLWLPHKPSKKCVNFVVIYTLWKSIWFRTGENNESMCSHVCAWAKVCRALHNIASHQLIEFLGIHKRKYVVLFFIIHTLSRSIFQACHLYIVTYRISQSWAFSLISWISSLFYPQYFFLACIIECSCFFHALTSHNAIINVNFLRNLSYSIFFHQFIH